MQKKSGFPSLAPLLGTFLVLVGLIASLAHGQESENLEDQFELESLVDFGGLEDLRYRLSYHPLSLEAVQKVRDDYGYLYLPEETRDWVTVRSSRVPWAGYWFPSRKIDELIGNSSPLSRLDYYLRLKGRSSQIVSQERATYHSVRRWASWDGHCHAWAMASVLFDEPQKGRAFRLGRRRRKVNFSVADLKAILMKAAEGVSHTVYGVRFGAGRPSLAESYGAFQDLRPEAFHRVVVENLRSDLPILIDDDPGVPVWTKPIYSVSYRTQPDPEIRNAILVEMHYVAMAEVKTFAASQRLTSESQARRYKVKYRLFHAGELNNNGEYKILRGEWIESSRDRHPDVVIVPNSGWQSLNDSFNKNIDLIQELFQ